MTFTRALCTIAIALSATACSGNEVDPTGPPAPPPPAPPPPPPPAPTKGNLTITTSTVGANLDPDGYTISIDGGIAQAIGINASKTVEVSAASHTVQLGGVAANCSPSGGPSKTGSVTGGGSFTIAFSITCSAIEVNPTGMIAFESNRAGNYDVWVMNADGTGVTRLTTNASYDFEPDWSPDGTKIAFVSRRDGNDEIYVMNADGSGQTRLTNHGGSDRNPSWSPDGTKIAFEGRRLGDDDLWVMNADGSNVIPLTDHPADDQHPAWSPDGSKIAFQSYQLGNNNMEVFVVNVNGTGLTNLSNHTGPFDGRPAWSPDGGKLAFVSGRTGNLEIYVMNANGSGQTQLTFDGELDSYPAWSPDGKFITFRSDRSGNIDVWVMKADGTGAANRTNHINTDCHPDWKAVAGSALRMPDTSTGQREIRPVTNRVSLSAQVQLEVACMAQ